MVVEKPLGGHHVRRQARAPRTEARRGLFPFLFLPHFVLGCIIATAVFTWRGYRFGGIIGKHHHGAASASALLEGSIIKEAGVGVYGSILPGLIYDTRLGGWVVGWSVGCIQYQSVPGLGSMLNTISIVYSS